MELAIIATNLPLSPSTVEDGLIDADEAIESSNQHHSSIVPGHVFAELAPPNDVI